MRTAEDRFIRRASAVIVIVSSLVIISLMLTGGCDGTATSIQIPTPTPTWAPSTGFPPECVGISLSCPAADFERAYCVNNECELIDNSVEPPQVIETFFINFSDSCDDVDCFTFECRDVPIGGVLESPIFIIESLNDYPVGEDIAGPFDFGFPKGTIILNGEEFVFSCGIIAVP